MLIVLPSLVSGVGIAFILGAILINHRITQDVFLVVGVILLWLDFFITMAIFRHFMRSLDERVERIEERLGE